MKRPATMTADKVLDVLCEKHFKNGPYSVLREVRSHTGYSNQDRSADALVVSCWPSRGVWFGGVEVKISRSDWQRELADPAKSHEIQRFCSYWWVVTPPGIVKTGEMPETWGHIEVTSQTCAVLKEAPKLDAEPPAVTFVASILRQLSKTQADALGRARYEARCEVLESGKNDDVETLKGELANALAQRDVAQKDQARLADAVQSFQVATGLSISGYRHDREKTLRLLGAARALAGFDLRSMAAVLENAVAVLKTSISEYEAETKQPTAEASS